jgi:SAM-dependent methyltransferase
MAWYEEFFGEDYVRFHLRGGEWLEERTAPQCDLVISALELQPGARVLDLCCGQGRHAVELVRRGFRVTGLDLSEHLLGLAHQRAEAAGVEVEFVQRDMRDIPWDNEFDAVVNLFTSFGYLESDEEDQRVLNAVRRALRPGGGLLIDHINRDRRPPGMDPDHRNWFEHECHLVLEQHEWDAVRSRITMIRTIIAPDGTRRQTGFVLRMYAHSEMMAMFQHAGLEWERTYGDYEGSDYGADSRGMIIVARRPAEAH